MTKHPAMLAGRHFGERKPTLIYRQIKEAILTGQLRAGVKMPAQRDYAGVLGVSRGTVNAAYARLRDEGYIQSRTGDGTYVSAEVPKKRRHRSVPGRRERLSRYGRLLSKSTPSWCNPKQDVVPFRLGRLALERFPFKTWHGYLREMPTVVASSLADYQPPTGYRRLRVALSETAMLSRGIHCTPDELIVTNGAQQGLSILFKVLCDPGDRVAIEDPCYPGSAAAIAATGLLPVPIAVDREGLRVDLLERERNVRAVVVSPTNQFPLGFQLSLKRRLALLRWAQQNDTWIVEDDPDGEFQYRYNPTPSLKSLDTGGRVIYLGSFSKTLFPAVRLGFIIGSAEIMQALGQAKALADRFTGIEAQWCLARFVESGEYVRHLKRSRDLYHTRRDTFVHYASVLFGANSFAGAAEAGLTICAYLDGRADDEGFCRAAGSRGVDVVSLSSYCFSTRIKGVLFSFAGFDEHQCRRALERLSPVVEQFKSSLFPSHAILPAPHKRG
jgi:GntR family transcriptional regulator / MocR family aminotransferase